jgi:hypothetical protein
MSEKQAIINAFDQTASGQRGFSELTPMEQERILRFADQLREPLRSENEVLRSRIARIRDLAKPGYVTDSMGDAPR